MQLLHRAGAGERESGLQRLGRLQLLAREPVVAGAGVDFRGDVMRLAALGLIPQHLRDHLLRCSEVAAAGRLVDLRGAGIGRERRQGAGHDEQGGKCRSEFLQHVH